MNNTNRSILNILACPNSDEHITKVASICEAACASHNLAMDFYQSDDAQEINKRIRASAANALIISPGFTGASLSDAIDHFAKSGKPVVEVQMNNSLSEPSSQQSEPIDISSATTGFIAGLGLNGYSLAIKSIAGKIKAIS